MKLGAQREFWKRLGSRTSPCLAITVWVTGGLAVQYTMKAMLAAMTMRAHHA